MNESNTDTNENREATPLSPKKPTTNFEKLYQEYTNSVSYLFIIVVLASFITLTTVTIIEKLIDSENHRRFWINQSVKYLSIFFIQLICGLCVKYRSFKVNYSRKIVHISYFVIPQLLDTIILYFHKTIYTELWNITIIYCLLLSLLEVIRKRFSLFKIMYAAIDRPEDRPFTTFWFVTQLSVSLPIIMGFSILFSSLDQNNFIFVPLWILAFGDGLAEPVGTKYGHHKYKVKGFLVKKEYTRSLEGSSCVYLASIISVLAYYNSFTKASITFCLIIMPFAMTFVEAYSPHTWDNPIILLTGYIIMTCAHYIE
jgi:dolichol kinase